MSDNYPLFILFSFLLLFSCKQKEEIITNEHTNVIVDDNTAPPYNEVTTVQIQNYINKLYIDLIGREPLSQEMDNITFLFKENDLSEAVRQQVIDELHEKDEYFFRLHQDFSIRYIGGADSIVIEDVIEQEELERDNAMASGNIPLAQYKQYEIDKLELLLNVRQDFQAGAISINEYMYRIAFNEIYDEINMGSENFVLSCFENFFKRFPTDSELSASVAMVDGFPSQLLLVDGINKPDFITIMTTSPGFYEGLTFDIYKQLLARNPNSGEMVEYTNLFIGGASFQNVQSRLMKTDEYAGF